MQVKMHKVRSENLEGKAIKGLGMVKTPEPFTWVMVMHLDDETIVEVVIKNECQMMALLGLIIRELDDIHYR